MIKPQQNKEESVVAGLFENESCKFLLRNSVKEDPYDL